MENLTKAILTNGEILNKAYDDAIHPTAENIGKAAGTLTSTLDLLLAPFSWAVYGFGIIDQRVKSALKEKLNNIPLDRLREPEANIVVPAYESLRYSLDKDSLREMYVNLIASSMVEDKKDSVHPAFVEIIKQLSPQDAKLLQDIFGKRRMQIPKIKILSLNNSDDPTRGMMLFTSILPSKFYSDDFTYADCVCCLENLERLKLIEITDYDISKDPFLMTMENTYEDINIDCFPINAFPTSLLKIIRGNIGLSNFGNKFVSSVF